MKSVSQLHVSHESFEINEDSKRPRLKVVRQDRKNVEDLECYLEVAPTRFKVLNLSSFGVLIRTEAVFEMDHLNCQLVLNDVDLGALNLRRVRSQQPDSSVSHTLAFEVIGPPIDVERINAVEDAQRLIKKNDDYQKSTKRIPDAFARKVYEIKDWLEVLQSEINSLEKKTTSTDVESIKNYEDTVVQVMGDYLNKVMPTRNQVLQEVIQDYNSDVIKNCYEFFRDKLKTLIYQSPFSDRVFNKPLGYAGDYEMMNIIYRSGLEGDTLFAKCLHNYWVKQPAAQAVRNRAQYLMRKIHEISASAKEPQLNVLSVACGPAMEWQELLRQNNLHNIQYRVDLLDQDEGALKHAQRRLKEAGAKSSVDAQFNYLNRAIKNVIGRGLDEKYDLIYSAGLFDYFSDPVAQIASIKLFDALKPGGTLIIGNFNVDNPNSIMMDLALDWNLVYRSKSDLDHMFACTKGIIEVEEEGLGINLFCNIKKAK